MSDPLVDVVVAVHDVRRDVARAARSALDPGIRVTVVCHGLEAHAVRPVLAADPHVAAALETGAVRLIEHQDGVPSPAGPFNAGLDAATGRYVAVLGSDDHLEPGAITAWARCGDARSSAAVLAPLRRADGVRVRNPLVRPFTGKVWPRSGEALDPVRDRLAARSAPLGLVRRSVVEDLDLRFTEGQRTGEDLAFTRRLWFSGLRLDLPRDAPSYVVGADAPERVTLQRRPLAEELTAITALRAEPWLEALPASARRAIAVTVLRVNVLGAVERRARPEDWAAGEPELLRELASSWLELATAAPGGSDALRPFSRADRHVLDAVVGTRAFGDRTRVLGDGTRVLGDGTRVFGDGTRALGDGTRALGDETRALGDGTRALGDGTRAFADEVVEGQRRRAAAGLAETLLTPQVRDSFDREGTLRRYVRDKMWW